ncbi:MAG: site-specific DNA-methyltransferase [Acidimicrobiia bacterium]|nr:site-specific DNA-methyltransferase [Acidimicrobiia bacterium]
MSDGTAPGLQLVLETPLGKLYRGDCLDLLAAMETASVDLVFADPPFNLKKDYGEGINDALADDDYLAWCHKWLAECVRVIADGGSIFVYNLPRWNVELGHYLTELGMTFRHWIAIDIKMSLPIPGRLYPSHYSLLYYSNGKPKRFERPRVPIPTCRHCGGDIKDYGGHRNKLNPDGLNLTDVWVDIPPVRHRGLKRRGANELSERLLERVLTIASAEGDLVFDPFGGSGTTYAAAERMHRHWIGIELGDTEPIVARLSGRTHHVAAPGRGDAGKGSNRARPTASPDHQSLF